MEFSHNVSLFFEAPTMSGMNDGHLCGQSCRHEQRHFSWATTQSLAVTQGLSLDPAETQSDAS